MKIILTKSQWEKIGKKAGWNEKNKIDYQKYLSFTPENGGQYYTLSIPENVTPPQEGDNLLINNKEVVVFTVSTPEDIEKGRGGPIAQKMRENKIGWRVNCLPKGHEYLKRLE